MTVEVVALLMTLVVHVIGAGVLIYVLLDGEDFDWSSLWPRDDDGGGGPRGPQPDGDVGPGEGSRPAIGPLPPDAVPSGVRLREPGWIREGYPKPSRRPEHVPERPQVPQRG